MARSDAPGEKRPRGVQELPRARGGRRFRARIRLGKAGDIHLGLYETAELAALAYEIAARAVGRTTGEEWTGRHSPEQARQVTATVRRRLGLDPPPPPPPDDPPDPDALLTMFEVGMVGFWRSEAGQPSENADAALDSAAKRLAQAARVVFWCHSAEHPTPLDALTGLLTDRLDRVFRRPALTRELLDDDGEELVRVARWLVHPDEPTGGLTRGFRAEVAYRYDVPRDDLRDASAPLPWAAILGLTEPFTVETIRRAYRSRSREVHPDIGGSTEAFVHLQRAYQQAMRACGPEG